MEKVELKVMVPKETSEFAEGICTFLETCIKEIQDNGGFAIGDDLPGIATAAIAFMPCLNGALSMSGEMKEDLGGFLTAWTVAGAKITNVIKAT